MLKYVKNWYFRKRFVKKSLACYSIIKVRSLFSRSLFVLLAYVSNHKVQRVQNTLCTVFDALNILDETHVADICFKIMF